MSLADMKRVDIEITANIAEYAVMHGMNYERARSLVLFKPENYRLMLAEIRQGGAA